METYDNDTAALLREVLDLIDELVDLTCPPARVEAALAKIKEGSSER